MPVHVGLVSVYQLDGHGRRPRCPAQADRSARHRMTAFGRGSLPRPHLTTSSVMKPVAALLVVTAYAYAVLRLIWLDFWPIKPRSADADF